MGWSPTGISGFGSPYYSRICEEALGTRIVRAEDYRLPEVLRGIGGRIAISDRIGAANHEVVELPPFPRADRPEPGSA